jgi:hypothetical protein
MREARVLEVIGINLNLDPEFVGNKILENINQQMHDLGVESLTMDYSQVDLRQLMMDSVYRTPPFSPGETEKGFRDALIVQALLQKVREDCAHSEIDYVCLVTGDKLMQKATESKIADLREGQLYENLDALQSLINGLVEEVDETFVKVVGEEAAKLFFASGAETPVNRDTVTERIKHEFETELSSKPDDATHRENLSWAAHQPVFVSKQGQEVSWLSQVVVTAVAYGYTIRFVNQAPPPLPAAFEPGSRLQESHGYVISYDVDGTWTPDEIANDTPLTFGRAFVDQLADSAARMRGYIKVERWEDRVARGQTVFEVEWRVRVLPDHTLRDATIDHIRLVGTEWSEIPAWRS